MGTHREDFKNGDADKSKVIPQLLPSKVVQCEETDNERPCCECGGGYISPRTDEEYAMSLLLGMFWFGGRDSTHETKRAEIEDFAPNKNN